MLNGKKHTALRHEYSSKSLISHATTRYVMKRSKFTILFAKGPFVLCTQPLKGHAPVLHQSQGLIHTHVRHVKLCSMVKTANFCIN